VTEGGAFVKDQLFSTLMTRTRQWDLGGGLNVMLSDTVGFVRDLPHNLVASFRATLEEATHADLLLIVLDVSDPSAELHFKTVMRTLDELFEEVRKSEENEDNDQEWVEPVRLLLLNKADLLDDNAELLLWQSKEEESIVISALPDADGMLAIGHEALTQRVRDAAQGAVRMLDITVPLSDSKSIHTLENRAEVLDREYTGTEVRLRCKVGSRVLAQLRSAGARLTIEPASGASPTLESDAPGGYA
jgi:GTP-binding protein HflX